MPATSSMMALAWAIASPVRLTARATARSGTSIPSSAARRLKASMRSTDVGIPSGAPTTAARAHPREAKCSATSSPPRTLSLLTRAAASPSIASSSRTTGGRAPGPAGKSVSRAGVKGAHRTAATSKDRASAR